MYLQLLIYLLYVAVRVRVTQARHCSLFRIWTMNVSRAIKRLSNLIYDTRSTFPSQTLILSRSLVSGCLWVIFGTNSSHTFS